MNSVIEGLVSALLAMGLTTAALVNGILVRKLFGDKK